MQNVVDYNMPSLDLNGPEWVEVERWLKDQLEHAYKGLAADITEAKTQQLRGRASLLQQMLGFREQRAAFGRTST